MNTHASKTQENKNQAVANNLPKQPEGSESSSQFTDDRPEAIAQRKVREMANNSPQVKQLRALQQTANNSPQAKQLRTVQALADNFTAQISHPKENSAEDTGDQSLNKEKEPAPGKNKEAAQFKNIAAYYSTAPNATLQLKRDITGEKAQADFASFKDRRGEDAEDDDTLETVKANYEKSLDSGRRLFGKGLKWFTNAPDKEAAVSTYGGTFTSVLDAGYKVFWFFPDDESVTICMTRGEEHKNQASREVGGYRFNGFDDDQDFFYANTFNVKTGAFHASINYRDKDSELAREEGLPPALSNSEIIWFQHEHAKDVYREKHNTNEALSEITSVSREEIGNTQTLDTIFMSDENQVAFKDGSVTLDEPTEEAIALLGSPNGNSAVWILIQHRTSGSLDIESIKYEKNSLLIKYMNT